MYLKGDNHHQSVGRCQEWGASRSVGLRMSPKGGLFDGHQAEFHLDNVLTPHSNPERGDMVVILQQRQRPRGMGLSYF